MILDTLPYLHENGNTIIIHNVQFI